MIPKHDSGRSPQPWQKSFRAIPRFVRQRVKALPNDNCRVGCTRKITKSQIEIGLFAHVGLVIDNNLPIYDSPMFPRATNGRYSRWNVEGREIVHRDQPKVTKTYDVETPNWGDWSNGFHTISWEREVYPRTFVPPRELGLEIELLGEDSLEQTYAIRFGIDATLDRSASNFEDELFFAINLLQENVGAVDVYPSEATITDYLGSQYVHWEILPPGESDANIARILHGVGDKNLEVRRRLTERYEALAKLKPKRFVQGTSGFRRYFGAQFASDLVVFENVEYGNAVYVLYEDWQSLSQKSRTELLNLHPDQFARILHRTGWRQKLRQLVLEELRKRDRRDRPDAAA